MTRFWISWYGGSDGDCRPIVYPIPFPWWCSGERFHEPCFSICAVIDAENEELAYEEAKEYWPELEERFCNPRPNEWMPDSSRFPVGNISKETSK